MTDHHVTSHDGTLERSPSGGVIRFERHLPYPIGEVWDAITTPARLADWWLPFDAEITVDLREGGLMTFTGRGDEPLNMSCTILRVEAPRLLEHTHLDGESRMLWELAPTEDGCRLRLSQFVTDPSRAIDGCHIVGLHTSLARLAPSLAGQPVPWDWDDFAHTQAHYAAVGLAPAVSE